MQKIHGKNHDLGDGFMVRRMLPSRELRAIGPFVFLDHFGPTVLAPERPMDVRPHPHIGLATVSYLWQGRIEHRDSLGSVQLIEPGAVNWMTSGRGIVHSERTAKNDRGQPMPMHGLQFWVALPADHAEDAPSFIHVEAADLPRLALPGADVRVVAGTAFGHRSPAPVASPTCYLDIHLEPDAELPLPREHAQLAVYVIDGQLTLDGTPLDSGDMVVLDADETPRATRASHVVVFGGAPLDGPRLLWWNFVARDDARLQQAREDWDADRLGHVEGDDERIPLPERRRPATPIAPN
ncbi:MAG TPA: pirin family protein [Rhodanobacteraceae bacterium]|nr:pirin family protein [Rhodanobacteraceae bacterium]